MSVVDEESITAPTNKNLNLLLRRSDSLRSSGSGGSGSLTSESKRVSFNNDVRIKRIPVKSKLATTNNGNEVAASTIIATRVTHQAVLPEEVEAETENILKQLEGIECQVSTYPPKVPNSLAASEASEEAKRKADNRLYGLHALNNLDIAVNGKEVNSMPSYQEIRKRENSNSSVNNLHSSDSNSSTNLQPPASKVPAKPPRRNSPVQRGQMTHYATPALIHSDLESVSSDLKTYRNHSKRLQDSLNAEDSAICSGGDADDSTVTSSYTSRFIRKSPPRQLVSTTATTTTSRMSPSRTCMTDSEILRSPSEVLYAVSDKYRHQNNELLTNTSSQTDRPPSRYVSASRPRSAYNYSSREDLVSNDEVGTYSRRSTSENNR